MISDVLREAAQQILDYLVRQPEVYSECTKEIQDVLMAMDRLMAVLDAPPDGKPWNRSASAVIDRAMVSARDSAERQTLAVSFPALLAPLRRR
jgi:hypothetical protein